MIKSTVITPAYWPMSEYVYPVLQVCPKGKSVDGTFVVLFTSRTVGVVVNADDDSRWTVGHFSDSWVPASFKPFDGAVKLENDL